MRWTAWLVPALLVAGATGGCGGTDDAGDGASPPDSAASATHRSGTPTNSAESETVESVDPRQTTVLRCADPSGETFRFEVRPRDGRVELWLPGRFGRRTVELDRVRADSGARYEAMDVAYWNRGDDALLRVEGEEFRGCTVDRGGWVWAAARRRGVDFRASGNEPGWYLELSRGDSMHLEYDYGERELTVATPEPVVESAGDRTLYRVGTSDTVLAVRIEEEPCTAMSGTRFPATVTVELDGQTYRGCGRWLEGAP